MQKNYRRINFSTISKMFLRLMYNQLFGFSKTFLVTSCSFNQGCNTKYDFLSSFNIVWVTLLGSVQNNFNGHFKSFQWCNHHLLTAKLVAFGINFFFLLHLRKDCLSQRQQTVKINSSLNNWKEILTGLPHGSVLGLLSLNIFTMTLSCCRMNAYGKLH